MYWIIYGSWFWKSIVVLFVNEVVHNPKQITNFNINFGEYCNWNRNSEWAYWCHYLLRLLLIAVLEKMTFFFFFLVTVFAHSFLTIVPEEYLSQKSKWKVKNLYMMSNKNHDPTGIMLCFKSEILLTIPNHNEVYG